MSGRVVKSVNESKAIQERTSFALLSENARTLPSGDQFKRTLPLLGPCTTYAGCRQEREPRRSHMSFSKERTNAICRLSGDHVGE